MKFLAILEVTVNRAELMDKIRQEYGGRNCEHVFANYPLAKHFRDFINNKFANNLFTIPSHMEVVRFDNVRIRDYVELFTGDTFSKFHATMEVEVQKDSKSNQLKRLVKNRIEYCLTQDFTLSKVCVKEMK